MDLTSKWSLPEVVRRRLADSDDELINPALACRRGTALADARITTRFETRENDDGTVGLIGYATTWDTWYDVAGGAPYGWSESIAAGAANNSLQRGDKVKFLFDHEGIPMASNTAATMRLAADTVGLYMELPSLDVKRNVFAAAVWSAIDRRDVDEMSFAFRAIRQEWNDDYTERRILELQLFDVSAVTFPANSATIIGVRSEAPVVEPVGMPLSLALAQAVALG
jgi:HK97 family phage prohead protease